MNLDYNVEFDRGGKIVGYYDNNFGVSLPAENDSGADTGYATASAAEHFAQAQKTVYTAIETPSLSERIVNWLTGSKSEIACNPKSDPGVFENDGEVPLVSPDGGNIPVDDAGQEYFPPDMFFEIDGQGSHYQSSPMLGLSTGDGTPIYVQPYVDSQLAIKLGLDSSLIANMPEGGYFPDMIHTGQLTQEDIDMGIPGCPEEEYESFIQCPSDESNRLPLYFAGYTIESYKFVGGEFVFDDSRSDILSTVQELFQNPESGRRMGIVAGDIQNPIFIPIPQDWYSDGTLYIKIWFDLIVDARAYTLPNPACDPEVDVCDAPYRNYLKASIIKQ